MDYGMGLNRALNNQNQSTEQLDATIPQHLANQPQQGIAPATTAWIDQIKTLSEQVESLEELENKLLEVYPNLSLDDFAEALAEATTAAHLAGRERTALAQIGEYLQRSTRERFKTQTDLDGTPWATLSDKTKKHRNQNKILTLRGHLQGRLRWQLTDNGVELGTNSIYAATHQFGMTKGYSGTGQYKTKQGSFPIPWGNIPARPFLGISQTDQTHILNIIETHIANTLNQPN